MGCILCHCYTHNNLTCGSFGSFHRFLLHVLPELTSDPPAALVELETDLGLQQVGRRCCGSCCILQVSWISEKQHVKQHVMTQSCMNNMHACYIQKSYTVIYNQIKSYKSYDRTFCMVFIHMNPKKYLPPLADPSVGLPLVTGAKWLILRDLLVSLHGAPGCMVILGH